MSALGCDEAQAFDPVAHNVGVVVIGHGALREERQQLVSLFREKVLENNPVLWERTVVQASQSCHDVLQTGLPPVGSCRNESRSVPPSSNSETRYGAPS